MGFVPIACEIPCVSIHLVWGWRSCYGDDQRLGTFSPDELHAVTIWHCVGLFALAWASSGLWCAVDRDFEA